MMRRRGSLRLGLLLVSVLALSPGSASIDVHERKSERHVASRAMRPSFIMLDPFSMEGLVCCELCQSNPFGGSNATPRRATSAAP